MEWTAVLSGISLGFAIAAPVGPIGILCIRRTLADGRLVGFVSGLGAATADALYGALAASGVALTATVAAPTTMWVRLASAVFLCWLGITQCMHRCLAARSSAVDVPSASLGHTAPRWC